MEKSASILAIKSDMRSLFDERGRVYPVTAVDTSGCIVVGSRTVDKDGYTALVLGLGERRAKTVNRAQTASLKKAGLSVVPRYLKEAAAPAEPITIGTVLTIADLFKPGDRVTVSGATKGKGFAGGVKRYGFAGGPRTHGQSDRERAPGSIGSTTTPGRVRKGQRMAGRKGGQTQTIKGLIVQDIDIANNLLYIKGAIPGSKGSLLLITK